MLRNKRINIIVHFENSVIPHLHHRNWLDGHMWFSWHMSWRYVDKRPLHYRGNTQKPSPLCHTLKRLNVFKVWDKDSDINTKFKDIEVGGVAHFAHKPRVFILHPLWTRSPTEDSHLCLTKMYACWITTTWVRISVWAYLKGVSSLTSFHYLWRLFGPFSLPRG